MSTNFKNTNHSYLRYANCWEDADVLLESLNIQTTDTVISVASAGDNTFSILSKSPKKVVAVDVNKVQLYLTELKKACFITLTYSEFLEFLGFEASKNRPRLFQKLESQLSMQTLHYWKENFEQIEKGIINQGKFENYFKLFRTKIIPLIHNRKKINTLLAPKSLDEQIEFYKSKWNTWRWRLLFNFFFSKTMMAKFGRDKSLFNEVELSVKNFIFNQAEKELSTLKCQTNYFLHFIFKGYFDTLPHYARQENFDAIKRNCHKLELRIGLIENVLTEKDSFDKFNLSNIFEYINISEFRILTKILENHSKPKAIYVNWCLMVKRNIIDVNAKFIELNTSKLQKIDKGFFYRNLKINQVK